MKPNIEAILRVNLAGEYGAKRIYEGQLAALPPGEAREAVEHMYKQELEHLAYFQKELGQRQGRPTLLHPLWHGLAYALGYATAKLGKKEAMVCTVAVEEVIDQHYAAQLQELPEGELSNTIQRFKEEEREHHDEALRHHARQSAFYTPLSKVIKGATRLAIALSKRI